MSKRILVVDDEKSIRASLADILTFEGYEVDQAENGEVGYKQLKKNTYDLVLCDIKMPKMDGIDLLQKAIDDGIDTPFIMISGHGNIDTAVEAIKNGAFDYISKPPDLNRLLQTVNVALENTKLKKENKRLKAKVSKKYNIIGDSDAINEVKKTIEKVAPTEARVLITGANGTGKELIAHNLHQLSDRREAPMVEVNCAAIPKELIESELFGHEKGSFTSSIKQRIGKFEEANGGTLFLDEIGDMSHSAQAKVLRALQEGKITRVGGEKDISVDVRVISATNKDLLAEVENNNFRLDLYHRLCVINIKTPNLKDRKSDIRPLTEYFADMIISENGMKPKTFDESAYKELEKKSWDGNIRELRNVVERLLILGEDIITGDTVKQYAS